MVEKTRSVLQQLLINYACRMKSCAWDLRWCWPSEVATLSTNLDANFSRFWQSMIAKTFLFDTVWLQMAKRDLAIFRQLTVHEDVIKWKHFPRYWLFVRGIHWSPVNSSHKGQWRGAFMFSSTPSRSLWRHCNDVLKKSQMYFDVIREGTLCFMSLHAMGITP